MTSPAPRYNQIDELTRGLDLPFVALQDEHLSVVAEVLEKAWADLLRTQPATLHFGSEAEVNALMETRLGQLLYEHSLWEQMVWCITRGRETLSFDGSHLEKRPDLSIHLTSRNQAFPLIVECKLIDAADGKGPDLYCENGLKRFLTGEYGWATQEAFMLAYVRDGSSIASALTPLLVRSQSRTPQPYLIEELPSVITTGAPHRARSRHGRLFRYPTRVPPGDAPGSIAVWHLWVATPSPATQRLTDRSDRVAGA
jgi:hypothetical protein